MNIKVVGLVVALGVSLSGCSGETATDDLKNCRDAHSAWYDYLDKTSITGLNWVEGPDGKLSLVQKVEDPDHKISLLQKWEDISSRATSQELTEALVADANYLGDDPINYELAVIDGFSFENVCVADYGEYLWITE